VSDDVVQVQTTAGTDTELARIVDDLLDRRLIACGQVVGPIRSRYWWRDSREEATEWLALLKTTVSRADAVVEALSAMHSYEVPEILVLPVGGGLPGYLDWVREETRG
jgi:periplasmic divalent cation tolerance protein